MIRLDRSFITREEVLWRSDVKLNQCKVTFRNIADIEEFLITRCFSRDFYKLMQENRVPLETDAPLFDESENYAISNIIRVELVESPWQAYYELSQGSTPPNTAPPADPPWTPLPDYEFDGQQIPQWDNTETYRKGDRVTFNGRYFQALQAHTSIHPSNTDTWGDIPRFYDPALNEFFCEYMANWLAFNIWFQKIPFIRGQEENSTIQYRFVDYQIAQEDTQSLRQEVQNHIYMIWNNMKAAFPNYFSNHQQYDNGCSDPTGVDCGQEALRKYAFRVA